MITNDLGQGGICPINLNSIMGVGLYMKWSFEDEYEDEYDLKIPMIEDEHEYEDDRLETSIIFDS
jgi:hypothetical protein